MNTNVTLRTVSGNNAGTIALLNTAFSSEQEKAFYQIPLVINTLQTMNNIKTFPIYDGTFLMRHIIIIEDITEYDQLQKQVMLSENWLLLAYLPQALPMDQ